MIEIARLTDAALDARSPRAIASEIWDGTNPLSN
jgi:hypothetical protein